MISDEIRLGLPIRSFDDAAAFDLWLSVEPRNSAGIWLMIAKKGASARGVSKRDAIDAALCHGWIDGQQHPYDGEFWLTRFTPRRPASLWSQVNRTRVGELMAAGRILCAGLTQIQAAKSDGRWDAAYAPASTAEPSAELLAALAAVPYAANSFSSLRRSERYAIMHRLNNLKTSAGRTRAIRQTVDMLVGRAAAVAAASSPKSSD